MRRFTSGTDWIVLVLALAVSIAMVVFAAAVLYEVVDHPGHLTEVPPGSSSVLVATITGIIGIIGSYVGYQQGHDQQNTEVPPAGPESASRPLPADNPPPDSPGIVYGQPDRPD